MGWTWQYVDAEGSIVPPPPSGTAEPFPAQGDAETWLGETWRSLADEGVAAVTLLEEQRVVYGPMSLSTPDA